MEKKLMLPANYNVMNEEEMTYTSGGDGFTAPFAVVGVEKEKDRMKSFFKVLLIALIFFPARILLPLMPFSLRSFLTVVPWRAAISERVSPFLMVTLLLPCFLFLPRLLLFLLRE